MGSDYTFSNHIRCIWENIEVLQDRIYELEIQLNILKNQQDKIFLLSIEEYEKYKKYIPSINTWWWLQSPGSNSCRAANVSSDDSVDNLGDFVYYDFGAVRPALKISKQEFENLNLGDRFVKHDFPWIKISNYLAIAEIPIAFRRFDKISNNYDNSEIKQFLQDWLKRRQH